MGLQGKPPALLRRLADLIFIRLLGLTLVLVAGAVLATLVTRLLVPPAPAPGHQWIFLKNLLLPLLLIWLYGRAVRVLERRDPAELSLAIGARLFPLGLVAGVACIGFYVLVLLAVGDAHVDSGSAPGGPVDMLNALLVPWLTAVGEEIIFRLILFRLIETALGTGLAALISAGLFGLSHVGNPGADTGSLLLLAAGFGLLMALAYATTRNLWLLVGLHMGWNLTEGSLFGLLNSGQREPVAWLKTTVSGSPWLTGGAFGPEGSLPLFALCVFGVVALVWVAGQRNQWQSLNGALQAWRSG